MHRRLRDAARRCRVINPVDKWGSMYPSVAVAVFERQDQGAKTTESLGAIPLQALAFVSGATSPVYPVVESSGEMFLIGEAYLRISNIGVVASIEGRGYRRENVHRKGHYIQFVPILKSHSAYTPRLFRHLPVSDCVDALDEVFGLA